MQHVIGNSHGKRSQFNIQYDDNLSHDYTYEVESKEMGGGHGIAIKKYKISSARVD